MTFFAAMVVGGLALIGVIVWLLWEFKVDRKWQDSIKPTVPQSKRLPPRDDL